MTRIVALLIAGFIACTLCACTSYHPKGHFPGARSTPAMTKTYGSRQECEAALDKMVQEVGDELLERDREQLGNVSCEEELTPFGTAVGFVLLAPLAVLGAWLDTC